MDRHVIVSRPPHAKRTREMPRSRVDKSVGKRIGRTDERGKSPSPAKPAAIEDGSPKFAESPEESAPPSPPSLDHCLENRTEMLPTRVCRSVQASAALRSRVARESYLKKLVKPQDLVHQCASRSLYTDTG